MREKKQLYGNYFCDSPHCDSPKLNMRGKNQLYGNHEVKHFKTLQAAQHKHFLFVEKNRVVTELFVGVRPLLVKISGFLTYIVTAKHDTMK